MTLKLTGKSAVVTGGGGGIGRAVSLALAEEGANVVVNDISRDTNCESVADKVVGEITKGKGIAVANYDDIATMQGGENIVKTTTSNFGRIDILVNCAGNYMRVHASEITEAQWDSIINVHLKGHFCCIKAAISEMVKQQSGRIINFSSRSAAGGGGNLAYSAAKAGVIAITRSLAVAMAPYNIRVNCVAPGTVETGLLKQAQVTPEHLEPILKQITLGRLSQPEEIAPAVLFMASDEASYILGQSLHVDGGNCML